jgi:hypothetical protein
MFDPSFHEKVHPHIIAIAEIVAGAALGTSPWWIILVTGFVNPILQCVVLSCAAIVGVAGVMRLLRRSKKGQ